MAEKTASKKRVLVVDDEPAILKILSLKLRVSGYEVISALSGEEALKLVESARPGIVLLDIILPGIDGLQVLQKVRLHSDLPIIAFSARSENGPKALSRGANDFLTKPFDVDELVKRIERLLGPGNL
jgi:two-component system KDP operon response regulator KdpE